MPATVSCLSRTATKRTLAVELRQVFQYVGSVINRQRHHAARIHAEVRAIVAEVMRLNNVDEAGISMILLSCRASSIVPKKTPPTAANVTSRLLKKLHCLRNLA